MAYDFINEYLYTTVVPVLLGGTAVAGKTALEMNLRHEIMPHWFGRGFDLRLMTVARRHVLPASVADMSDELLLQILLDFAAEQSGLLALYPCALEAEAFVNRNLAALESRFVILALPSEGDPLSPLVRKSC